MALLIAWLALPLIPLSILAFLVWAGYCWRRWREPEYRTCRRDGAILVVLALMLPLSGWLQWKAQPENGRSFDRRQWLQTDPGATDSPRLSMTGDLLRRHLKPGMTRAQVLDLLGPPEDEGPAEAIYPLGGYTGFLVVEELRVHYDEAGRLIRGERTRR